MIPAYFATGPGDPGLAAWKRDHPDWFEAGTWTVQSAASHEPSSQGTNVSLAGGNATAPLPARKRERRWRDPAVAATRTTVGSGKQPPPPLDPSTISLAEFRNLVMTIKDDDSLISGATPPLSQPASKLRDIGQVFQLPDGNPLRDSHSETGYLMTPRDSGAEDVAAAGRQAGEMFYEMYTQSASSIKEREQSQLRAVEQFYVQVGLALGHGGTFDYQRTGDIFSGYNQLRQFRDISNFNVGLYCQQSGMGLDETLRIAGAFAQLRSSNTRPSQPYGLDEQTAEFIRMGYQSGESGFYGPPARRP